MSDDLVRMFLAEMEAPFVSAWCTPGAEPELTITGSGSLPSVFATTDLATASIAAAGRAAARVAGLLSRGSTDGAQDHGAESAGRRVGVDRRLASLWFGWTLGPIGWTMPGPWDDLAGVYRTADGGWIRLHTNAPHHRRAALAVLGFGSEGRLGDGPTRDQVTVRVAEWSGDDLEREVVEAGGCAARMRSEAEWLDHAQGSSVAVEPTVHIEHRPKSAHGTGHGSGSASATPARPLAGVRVLDLTRVLAGPVATRFLAGLGADVLRLDPPDWDEPGVVPEVTLGKRCGRVDLRTKQGRRLLVELLTDADVFVHGYRGDALDGLGLGAEVRREVAPDLVDVSLDAYGWTGPWRHRRGFDSLVQMSCGIADAGGRTLTAGGGVEPRPLPVQALDHATGYLMAAAALHGWARRLEGEGGLRARVSLARTAVILMAGPRTDPGSSIAPVTAEDWEPTVEATGWGPARRLRPPVAINGVRFEWERPAGALGTETDLTWA